MSWIEKLEADLKVSKDPAGAVEELTQLRAEVAALRALVGALVDCLSTVRAVVEEAGKPGFVEDIDHYCAKAKEQGK